MAHGSFPWMSVDVFIAWEELKVKTHIFQHDACVSNLTCTALWCAHTCAYGRTLLGKMRHVLRQEGPVFAGPIKTGLSAACSHLSASRLDMEILKEHVCFHEPHVQCLQKSKGTGKDGRVIIDPKSLTVRNSGTKGRGKHQHNLHVHFP